MAIGIFDSGVGGLSIAQQVRTLLPHEDLIYLADSGHAPYGEKSQQYILQRCTKIIQCLIDKGATLVVIACNTATVSAISVLREAFAIPIVGVEPGVKTAVKSCKSGVVGILATTQTLKSAPFQQLAQRFSNKIKVEAQACPGLVEQVEALHLTDHKTQALVAQYVQPLLNKGADHLVLGCTHYAFLAPVISQVAGPNVSIINTAIPVALEVARRLDVEVLASASTTAGGECFFSSGEQDLAHRQFNALWGNAVKVALF